MKRGLALFALLALAGCATQAALRNGQKAERRGEYDRAVLLYAKALKDDPDDAKLRDFLGRARLRASADHIASSRRFETRGQLKEAEEELRLAQNLDPASAAVANEIKLLEERRAQATAMPSLAEIRERTRERSLPGLALGPEAREPLSLTFRGTRVREAYQALGKAVGVNFVFDSGIGDQAIDLDVADVSFEQALTALSGTARTFHRVVDRRVVLVVPDTPAKRRDFEQQVVKTFFLSNADLKETIDLLRVVLGARRVAPLPGANALTINDTPEKVAAAERIVEMVDKKRAEIAIDVEILEVNRTRLKEYGIEITSAAPGVDGIVGLAFPDPAADNTLGSNPYHKDNIVLSSLPGVIYRLLQDDSATRLLANPQLRSSEGHTAQARFGDQVPVPVTTFTPIAQGGISQQPVTSFEYKNVGVNIDITPRVHQDGDVTLQLKLEISAPGPLGYGDVPSFSNRSVQSVLRLRDGETTLIAGLIRDEERQSLTGLPGLVNIPLIGRLFARNHEEGIETDIVVTLTPHVLARPVLDEDDLRSFTVGGESSPVLFEIPPAGPGTPPAARQPSRFEPIRPPAGSTPAGGILAPAPVPSPAPES